jgi:phosphoribosylformimino-5-aminoimidazole carboxamide ribotide isomerase
MIEIIPAIDIIDGKCVRLTKGDYDTKKVYGKDPVDMAREVEDHGFTRLHVVDLDGAKSKHVVNEKVLHAITSATKLRVDFGGGIKTEEDITKVLDNGAAMLTIGSVAVTHPELFMQWLEKFGSDALILGADVNRGMISINGWKEDSKEALLPFLERYMQAGVQRVLCTEISKDGMLQGPSTELYKSIMERFPECKLIASGGVSCMEDIKNLYNAKIPAVVMGKSLYEGRITLKELAEWNETYNK